MLRFRLQITDSGKRIFAGYSEDLKHLETINIPGTRDLSEWDDDWMEWRPMAAKLVAESRAREMPIPSPEGNGFDHPNDWLEIHE